MKIMKNKKIFFLALILAALACNFVFSVQFEKKSQTVFEFFNGLNTVSKNYKKQDTNKAEPPKVNNAAKAAGDPAADTKAAGAPVADAKEGEAQAKNQDLEDWFFISSPEFHENTIWPYIPLRNGNKIKIQKDQRNFRINPSFSEESKDENSPPSPVSFYFRLTGTHLYYSYTKTDFNLAGAISIESIEKLDKTDSTSLFTITIHDHYATEYSLFTESSEIREKWWIQINKNLGIDLPEFHQNVEFSSKLDMSKFEKFEIEEKIIQPIIMVPLPRKKCNENWSYKNLGTDWECICKEGREQSPIDLPSNLKAIDSPITPLLEFHNIKLTDHAASLDGLVTSSELEVRYLKGALRVLYPNLGKLVTLDGTVYIAEEIVFHTPAEHTIDGVRYDMEMQILHYGRSKGDIAKQAVVSFLFKKSPGMFPKFFESFDIFSLPNQIFRKAKLVNDIDINRLFYDIESNEKMEFKPFSFYTYQGSLTFPPCTERTIHYVASKPIPLGEMIIQHFREAIGTPNYTDSHYFFESDEKNYRETQLLNDRDIFYFDHERYCGKDPVIPKEKPIDGHFERIMSKAWHYYHINTDEPSNLAGAEVVTEKEAKNMFPDLK